MSKSTRPRTLIVCLALATLLPTWTSFAQHQSKKNKIQITPYENCLKNADEDFTWCLELNDLWACMKVLQLTVNVDCPCKQTQDMRPYFCGNTPEAACSKASLRCTIKAQVDSETCLASSTPPADCNTLLSNSFVSCQQRYEECLPKKGDARTANGPVL